MQQVCIFVIQSDPRVFNINMVFPRPSCTRHSGKHTHGTLRTPFHSPTYSLSEWHLLWKEGHSFRARVSISFQHFHRTLRIRASWLWDSRQTPIPSYSTHSSGTCGESSLTGQKAQRDAIAQVLRHTSELCLSKTGWAGQKPSGFYTLIFLYPPLTKELIYNNQKLLQHIFSSSVTLIPQQLLVCY